MEINKQRINKILIINLGGIGDMIVSIPFLRGLRKKYDKSKIVLLTISNSYRIINNLGYIDKAILMDYKTRDARTFNIKIIKQLMFVLSLRKEKFDMIINLRPLTNHMAALKMALIFYLIGGKYWIGRDSEGLGFFYNIKIPEKRNFKKHEIDYHKELAERLAINVNDDARIKFEKKNIIFANKFLKRNKIRKKDKLVMVNAESAMPIKIWPEYIYMQLMRELNKKINWKIIVITYKNIKTEEKIKEQFKNIIILNDKNIKNVASVIKRANVFITIDSGPMHIAASFNIPIVSIHGPIDPYLTGPNISKNKYIIIYNKVDCSPCNRIKCNSMKCMKNIKTKEIISAAEELLKYGVKKTR
ncbi:MAG: glycosyltransferase family 9 protein [Candidatus Firestonebacteria bacterium]